MTKIGLVGAPRSGKTTVFGAITAATVDTKYKATQANLSSVKVQDDRIDALSQLYSTKKKTYATVSFMDIPGSTSGSTFDRTTLNNMRNVDALCQVLRAFSSDSHAQSPNFLQELLDFEAEIILADLELVERRITTIKKERGDIRHLELLQKLYETLENSHPLRMLSLNESEKKELSCYQFLSSKPVLLVINVDEEGIASQCPNEISVEAKKRGLGTIVLSAEIEMDIARMPQDDQKEFLESLGLLKSAKDRFIQSAFALLDLVSMITAGEDECRAWPIQRDSKAVHAAGKIHSDIERGFIRAEVIACHDLLEQGSESKCRTSGLLRVEGKNYLVQDGDVINFRFNV